MIKILGHIILFASFLSLVSCEKEIDIDIPAAEKKIVIHSYIAESSPVKVKIGYASNYGNDNMPIVDSIKNAIVKLYEDNKFKCTLDYKKTSQSNGYSLYTADSLLPKALTTYKLVISTPNIDYQITAETSIPKKPVVSFKESPNPNYFNILINDKPGNDFYLVQNNSGYTFRDDSSIRKIYTVISSNDPAIIINSKHNKGLLLFKDELFEGQLYDLSISIAPQLNVSSFYSDVSFYSISPEAYYYHKTVLQQSTADDLPFLGDFSLPVSEPMQVYSNIKNGLGVFAGINMITDTVKVYNQL